MLVPDKFYRDYWCSLSLICMPYHSRRVAVCLCMFELMIYPQFFAWNSLINGANFMTQQFPQRLRSQPGPSNSLCPGESCWLAFFLLKIELWGFSDWSCLSSLFLVLHPAEKAVLCGLLSVGFPEWNEAELTTNPTVKWAMIPQGICILRTKELDLFDLSSHQIFR